MAKPKSKKELLEAGKKNFRTLMDLVNSYSDEDLERAFPSGYLNRNIRDVLTHVHRWHLMMLDWYDIGMIGGQPHMPAEGYTWKTLPELNKKIWQECQDIQLSNAIELLKNSHNNVFQIIVKHTDQELFQKKRYKWTGSTSLGAYLILNTASHYSWAIKLITKSMK